jgi:hypothetical protein
LRTQIEPSTPLASKISQLVDQCIRENKSYYDFKKRLYTLENNYEQQQLMLDLIKKFESNSNPSGFVAHVDMTDFVLNSKNTIDRERTKAVLTSILAEKDDRKEREDRRGARDNQVAMSSEELDPVIDTMEEGVFTYISQILAELYKVNHIINVNKTWNSVIKDRTLQENTPFCNVTLVDPLVEYKNVEKMEMEDQKRNENKIQNKEQKPDAQEEKVSQKPVSGIDGAGNQAKKKKPVFDDYTEIYRILLKNKQEKLKENDSKDKNAEDQKKCVEIFAKESNFANQRNNLEPSFVRRPDFYEVLLYDLEKRRTIKLYHDESPHLLL